MTDREKLDDLFADGKCPAWFIDNKQRLDTVDYLISNGVTVNEWRPASEPPKEVGYYLVVVKNEHGRKYTKSAYYHGNGHWFANQSVTHWMPLPQLPKEVE